MEGFRVVSSAVATIPRTGLQATVRITTNGEDKMVMKVVFTASKPAANKGEKGDMFFTSSKPAMKKHAGA
jgi:hypothetical protein